MKINILGGGTSGWWTAGYLRRNHPDIEITIIEAPNPVVHAVGVGESSMPNVRAFFEELAINEDDWLDTCSGIRKQCNIRSNFSGENDDPLKFLFIHSGFAEWFEKYKKGEVTKASMYDLYDQDDWRGYAYHIDSSQAWQIVKEQTNGITHIVKEVKSKSDLPPADLHIDCSGFSRVLVKDKTIKRYPNLNNNACVVRRIERPPNPYTETTARDYGWEFKISLSDNRAGCGYVFDSNFISIEEAKEEYMRCNANETFLSDFRVLQWEPGRLTHAWQGDVVAVGLSAGFIEPLESNGLSIMISQIRTLSKVLYKPNREKIFNRMTNHVYDEVADFLWHSYACTNRSDTDYWKEKAALDGEATLWKRIEERTNLQQHLYPSYVYAYLAIYYNLI